MSLKTTLAKYPKAVIAGVFVLGASAWYLPLQLAAVLAGGLVGMALFLGACKAGFRKLFLAYAAFTLLWAAGRLGFALYNDAGIATGLWLAFELVLRLFLIAGAGACLLLLLTPSRIAREAGLIVRWASPDSFWKLSLAILVMLSYFEAALFAWQGVSQALKLRCDRVSLSGRIRIAGTALLRLLARQTWERTFAIASRKLDSPDAWV